MDPVSLVFSAYLNTVQSTVSNHFNETRNLQITPVVMEYEGTPISYQHQLWRVRPESVCSNHQQSISQFSRCTVKASRLFKALCSELRQVGSDDLQRIQAQNMYCNAAVSFKPTVADLGSAQSLSGLEEARQACNAATVAAMGNSDLVLAREREQACATYCEAKTP
ncbi:hypothetical protein SAMN05216369_1346 [Marinobacter antarcticus]|uniref:Uncharacterized protein n=1 Tax=Marinobacter antarcticus TaxID=564117 RepID=A0A1M6R7I1_9GAMM|nr:hypothetical protein SAMN05216369_1346 [Marinobacter antarcticus]